MIVKPAISVLGMIMLAVSTTYAAHADASMMAYIAAGCASVGAYLVGLFQSKPGT